MFIKDKRNKGITLIALVVTIIVLLILAGISIMMLTGEGGILNNANKAKIESTHAEVKEAMQLEYAEYMLEKNTKGSTQTLIEYLQGKNIIPSETAEEGKYVISVEALVGGKLSLGNGTDGQTDVYKLEEATDETATGKTNEIGKIASNTPVKIAETETTGKTYKIVYYGKKAEENKDLGVLKDSSSSSSEGTDEFGEYIDPNDPIEDILAANLIVKQSGKVVLLNNETPEGAHKVEKLTNLDRGKVITESGIVSYSLEKNDGSYISVTVFTDGEGKVYEYDDNSNSITCVSDIEGSILKDKKIVKVLSTQAAIDEDGKLYAWSNGATIISGVDYNYEEMGEKGICINDIPGNALEGKKIVNISENSAIDEEGKVYTWNLNKPVTCISDIPGNTLNGKVIKNIYTKGILGLDRPISYYAIDDEGKLYKWSDEESITCISDIAGSALNGKVVKNVYIGSIYQGNIGDYAIDEQGKLYEWDIGTSGGLLNRKTEGSDIPVCISDISGNVLSGKKISKVLLHEDVNRYTLIMDEEGKVYVFGLDEEKNGLLEGMSKDLTCINEKLNNEKIKFITMDDRTLSVDMEHGTYYSNGILMGNDKNIFSVRYLYDSIGECVYPNSNILVSKEGKTIEAKDIKEGADIAYYNFETNKVEIGKVQHAYIHKKATDFVKYEFEDGSYLEATDYHPIYTKQGWKSYTRRNGYEVPVIGDEVKTESGWKKLTKIESFQGLEDCYDFEIIGANGQKVNNYFANGTLVQGSY